MFPKSDWIVTILGIFDYGVAFLVTLMPSFSGGIRLSISLKVCQFHV